MKKLFIILPVFTFIIFGFFIYQNNLSENYGAPPYIEEGPEPSADFGKFGDLSKWVRPEGPLRVGLQAGHWKNNELPDELKRLRESGGGTSSGSVPEWEVNVAIAEAAKLLLEKEGIVVEILPATIPSAYYADAVVSIHADGNLNPAVNGFKVTEPRRDYTGKGAILSDIIEEEYALGTGLPVDPNITRNMTGYYAFNWRRYEHSIHPMAPAVILETGFLTNPYEARLLINNPEIPAGALAKSIIRFLKPL